MAMEWDKLPIVVLRKIVKNATENTRNALRACSTGNKELVETTRLNSIYCLTTKKVEEGNEEKWEILIEKDQFGTPIIITCADFESLKSELIRDLEHVDYVKVLHFSRIPPGKQLSLKRNESQRKIRVEHVLLSFVDGAVVENVLSQIEPVYLRKVDMLSDGGNSQIYDMPQIVHAEELRVLRRTSINETQLLKLEARDVNLPEPSFGLRNYIKKCSRDVGRVMPRFKFRNVDSSLDIFNINFASKLKNKEFLLDTDVPEIKLKLTLEKLKNTSPLRFDVEGTLLYESQRAAPHISHFHQTALRRIERIIVSSVGRDNSKWTICVIYKFQSLKHSTGPVGEIQKVLDDVLENTDHVQGFYIGLSPAMTWQPRKTKLIVNELIVCSKNLENVHSLLQQIDPIYLGSLNIVTQDTIGEEAFNIPHIDHLENLNISSEKNSRRLVSPLRLIRWSLEESVPHEGPSVPKDDNLEEPTDRFATEKFINRYLKHVMRRLNKKACNFDFYQEKEGDNEEDRHLDLPKILEGVDVIGSKRNDSDSKLYIYVDSPYPEYVILLIYYKNEIQGRREKRKYVPSDIDNHNLQI